MSTNVVRRAAGSPFRRGGFCRASILVVTWMLAAPSFAQSSLPPHVQADVIKVKIIEGAKRSDLKAVLAGIDEINALKVPVTPALRFLEAKAASQTGHLTRAFAALEQFLATSERSSPQYGEALALYPQYQAAAKAAAGKEIAKDIQLVTIPGGAYQMGDSEGDGAADERPVHAVNVKPFKLGKYEVTVGQFRMFATATDYRTEAERNVDVNGCYVLDVASGKRDWRAGASWSAPGFDQSNSHPVVCVSWNDAKAFIEWLNRESGRRFRLPNEAEWEYAVLAGSTSQYPWGSNADEGCRYANGADQKAWPDGKTFSKKMECNDGFFYPAPVGSYAANGYGLHDMIGNTWEWTEDCWNGSYAGAPTDGSAWSTGDCSRRVIRGGSWDNGPVNLRVSFRIWTAPTARIDNQGFRLAEDP